MEDLRLNNMRELLITGTPLSGVTIAALTSQMPNLEKLRLNDLPSVGKGLLDSLVALNPQLTHLEINGCGRAVTDRSLRLAFEYLPKLKTISVLHMSRPPPTFGNQHVWSLLHYLQYFVYRDDYRDFIR